MKGIDEGERRGEYVTFFREESNKEPVCDVKVNWIKLEGGTAVLCPVAGKIRGPGSAQAPSVPLNISPMVWLRQPAPIASACHGGMVGCGKQAWQSVKVGENGHQKGCALSEKLGCSA